MDEEVIGLTFEARRNLAEQVHREAARKEKDIILAALQLFPEFRKELVESLTKEILQLVVDNLAAQGDLLVTTGSTDTPIIND